MRLAAIVGLGLLSLTSTSLSPLRPGLSSSAPAASALPAPRSQDSSAASQPQPAPTAQNPASAKPLPSANGQTQNSAAPAKPSPAKPRHHKKPIPSNCSNAPTALNTAPANPASSTPPKPCPPTRKVIREGGSDEPKEQLTGGTNVDQASEKSSTEQLAAATEENLKKAAALQLNPSQQEMVNQIKQFMEQSKAAVAAGDVERGHNLALKARLLSDELVKP